MYRFFILSICPYSADAFLEWLSPSNQSISMSNKNSLASLLSVLCHGLKEFIGDALPRKWKKTMWYHTSLVKWCEHWGRSYHTASSSVPWIESYHHLPQAKFMFCLLRYFLYLDKVLLCESQHVVDWLLELLKLSVNVSLFTSIS